MGQGQRFWAEADNKNTLISFWIDCSPRVSCQWSENEKNPKGASWIPQNLESDSETILASLGSWAQLQNRRKPGNHFCRLLHIFMSNKIFYFLWYTHYINEYHFFPVVGRFFSSPKEHFLTSHEHAPFITRSYFLLSAVKILLLTTDYLGNCFFFFPCLLPRPSLWYQ